MEQFGRYVIITEIDRGGMATVYLANDPQIKRQVAIKVLPRELLHDQKFLARFNREAKMVGRLDHPAIIPVYDFGEQDGQPYLVMKYASGGNLKQRMKSGSLTIFKVKQIITEIAEALDYAHKQGVIHRDIKPENILFDDQDHVLLSDFGIAKLQETTSTLSGTTLVGTPEYMSPEQAKGTEEIDGRSDQYNLAIIAYQLLSGHPPYNAENPLGLALAHINEPVLDIRRHNPKISNATARVLSKALAKKPRARFRTCSSFAKALTKTIQFMPEEKITSIIPDLEEVDEDVHIPPTSLTSQKKRRNPTLRLLGILLLGIIIGLVLLSTSTNLLFPGIFATQTFTPTASFTSTATSTPTITLTPTITPTSTATTKPTKTPTATIDPTIKYRLEFRNTCVEPISVIDYFSLKPAERRVISISGGAQYYTIKYTHLIDIGGPRYYVSLYITGNTTILLGCDGYSLE